jgi:imidazolonepropionase-like amidohydrolase
MQKVPLALEHVTLHDGVSERARPDTLVLVKGGKILFVGEAQDAPPYQAEQTLDGKGGFLLPGFIDLHVHALADPFSLRSFPANGITTIRDLASPVLQAVEWRQRERRGEPGLPRVFASGPILTCEGGYPATVWGPDVAAFVSGSYQAQERAIKLLGMGLDVLKVGLEHELGPCLSTTEVRAISDTAHALGKRTTVHLTDARDFELALQAGVDEAAHMPSRVIPDELWKEAAHRGMIILPTLHAHAGWAKEWERRKDHPFGCRCLAGFQEGYHQALRNTERFLSFGGRLAYGTDAGNPHMPFGVSVEEWQDLQRCGLTPHQCLRMCTSEAATWLGEGERLGRVDAGYAADLTFYRHDPLQNPMNLRTLEWTIKGGEWVERLPLEFPPPFDLDYWIRQWEVNQRKAPKELAPDTAVQDKPNFTAETRKRREKP